MKIPVLPILTALLFIVLLLGGGPRAEAAKAWKDLNGRVAPDLVFTETALGLQAGTRLSSFRGKQVVLLCFWLRDCPHCKRELPKVQRVHDLWSRSGLSVISVVHGFALAEVTPVMAERGWTFPVVRDVDGAMADQYGGGRRPGYYLIGIDGRIKASNQLSDPTIQGELGRWRLAELGDVPAELSAARGHVKVGDYGAALRAAEGAARQAAASAAVRAAAARLATIAGRKLQNRVDRAEEWFRRGWAEKARQEYAGLVSAFRGTSLESRARALAENFASRAGD